MQGPFRLKNNGNRMGPAQTYIHLFNSILFTLFLESNGPLSLQNPLKRNPNNHILSPQKEIKKSRKIEILIIPYLRKLKIKRLKNGVSNLKGKVGPDLHLPNCMHLKPAKS